MSSIRRIIASRANGAKSRGPVTPEGKRTSAANALRHGLTAETVVLKNENPETFKELLAEYYEKFQPRDAVEAFYVDRMAVAHWRHLRLWAMELATLDLQIDRQKKELDRELVKPDFATRSAVAFTTIEAEKRSVSLFARYEIRMRCEHEHAIKGLERICEEDNNRFPNKPSPISGQ